MRNNPRNIFRNSTKNKRNSRKNFWRYSKKYGCCIDNNAEKLKKEDINSIKPLGKLLGKTDIDGQVSQIKLVYEFLEEQIKDATEEKIKNEKMYQKLGAIVGLVMVIVLVW